MLDATGGCEMFLLRLRADVEMHSLIAELHADHQQPRGKNQAQLLIGQARRNRASRDRTKESARKKLCQECRIEILAEQVQAATDG